MASYSFNPSILRAYDIRGIVGDTLSEADAHAIGRCFGTIVRDRGGSKVVIGRDGRLSSPSLEKALVKGLMKCGVNVLKVGLIPTPGLYFAEHHCEADGGIMITGSHNPMDYNGFKMTLGKRAFHGADITAFAKLAESGTYAQGEGSEADFDIQSAYIDQIVADFDKNYASGKSLKVAWDTGNGVAGPCVSELIKKLPGEHILLNEEVDGSFPNHHPDPQDEKNMRQLQSVVIDQACDIGIAFDGDADRIGSIDNKGNIIWGDQLLLLFAEEVLKLNPGASIVGDVKSSQALFDGIANLGGEGVMWRTGHSLIKKKMRELDAALGGEVSGHIFFRDRYYGFDDALYAAMRLMGIISCRAEPLSTWYESLEKPVNTPEIKIPCADEIKFQIVDEIKNRIKSSNQNCVDIDGVRVISDKGWWLLRASNTSGALVARIEANTVEDLKDLKQDLVSNLTQSGIEISA